MDQHQEDSTALESIETHEEGKVDSTISTAVINAPKNIVISVVSPRGGVGKSSVALLTAAQLAYASRKSFEKGESDTPLKVCIVDLDVFDGQLGYLFESTTPTALNIALSESVLDAELVQQNLVYSEKAGVHALLAPIRGVAARYTDAEFYKKVIRILNTLFEVVILDTSGQPYEDLIKNVALPVSDTILLVTSPSKSSVQSVSEWLDTACSDSVQGSEEIDRNKVGIVINGLSPDTFADFDNNSFTTSVVASIPSDPVAFQSATGNQLEELIHHSTIGPEYYKLAKSLSSSTSSPII